jgi:hypothetical protein
MSRAYLTLITAGALTALSGADALADDRAPTAEEAVQIEEVLRAEGFTSWEEIEFDDGVWEVDDAVAADGTKYDLTLDPTFAIIERDED